MLKILLEYYSLKSHTIILLKSVCLSVDVSKLQVAILARSSREMSQTVCIDWKHMPSRVRISVRPRHFSIHKKHPKLSQIPSRPRDRLFEWSSDRPLIERGTGEKGRNSVMVGRHWLIEQRKPERRWRWVGVCVCFCMRACVMCLQYTIILFDPGW